MSQALSGRQADTGTFVDLVNKEVPLSVLTDQAVYDAEMERIFARSWLLLGHETEIPNSGDYVTRDMGNDQVIVSRDSKGEIHVMLNMCSHRGMRVCQAERGNAARYQCIFHGWVFRPDGSFVGAPMPAEKMHGDLYAKERLGLKKARVSLYGGFIFATWDFGGPSFDEWLGDYKFYMDILVRRTKGGLEVLGPPQRLVLDTNWKLPSEASAGDGYHTLTLHRSVAEMGALTGEANLSVESQSETQCEADVSVNGHGMHLLGAFRPAPRHLDPLERLRIVPPAGMTREQIEELNEDLTPAQIRLMADFGGAACGMFPNIGFLCVYPGPEAPEGMPNGGLIVHTFNPRGPGRHEFLTWFLAEKSTSEEGKAYLLDFAVRLFGTTGMIEIDDNDALLQLQALAAGQQGKMQTMKYQALRGEDRPEGWEGGGKVYQGFKKDDTQWEFWKRYDEMMSLA